MSASAAIAAAWVWLGRQADPAVVWRAELTSAARHLAAGDIAGAETALEAALVAADEPEMQAVALEQLARLSLAQGALSQARAHATGAVAALDGAAAYARAAELWRQEVGPDHANVVQMLDGLGRMQLQLERPDDAAGAFADSVAMQRRLSTEASDALGEALNNWAEARRMAGRDRDAESLYREAADVFTAVHGDDHRTVATALGNLAALYVTRDQFADAEELFARALAMLGEAHPARAAMLENYAVLMERAQRPERAAELRERASLVRSLGGGAAR